LQAGQVNENRECLFVVTQAVDQQSCLATAIHSVTGQICWQRRLGALCQADPLVVGGEVLVHDRNGDLFRFDPNEKLDGKEQWQPGGHLVPPVSKANVAAQTYLLPSPDGQAAYALTAVPVGTGMELMVRRLQDGQVVTRTYKFLEQLAGTPAVGPDFLLLPLANSFFAWQPFPSGDGELRSYPASKDALSHAVYLSPDEYLLTNGSRHLGRWRWPDKKGAPKEEVHADFPDRITAPPVVVSPDEICVATAGARVWLLQTSDLRRIRSWELDGKEITAGPFVAANRIGCVVDHQCLVWMDPAGDVLWKYRTAGQGIVGRPHLVGDVLVVADRAGKLFGLDPATGKPRGSTYTLKASVSPAAAPVAFGPDRLFMPLSDGSFLLLPLDQFK
jgi:outer membrane protein assembly factor BamB